MTTNCGDIGRGGFGLGTELVGYDWLGLGSDAFDSVGAANALAISANSAVDVGLVVVAARLPMSDIPGNTHPRGSSK